MEQKPPPFVQLITRQLELWAEQRSELKRKIDEIDRKVADAAKVLGVDLGDSIDPVVDSPKLPKREIGARSQGTMAQFIRDFMAGADRGYTRAELKAEVRNADARFADMLNRNENGYYNTVKRLVGRELTDIDGVLYDSKRAPAEGGPAIDLGSNVTLFSQAKQGGADVINNG